MSLSESGHDDDAVIDAVEAGFLDAPHAERRYLKPSLVIEHLTFTRTRYFPSRKLLQLTVTR